ncbi:MAG: endolytic transglycosylase MltG [Microgenomates group bacterium]
MRYFVSLVLTFGVIAVMIVSLFGQPVSNDTTKVEFLITPGQSIDQIADTLSQAKLIRSRTVFKLTVFRLNIAKKIQAGYFFLSPSQTTAEIAQSLTKASTKQAWVTIPEGFRREEIANLVIDKLVESNTKHRFDPDEFIRQTSKFEGRLFPDTYALGENITTSEVIEKMTSRFNEITADIGISSNKLNQVVILASLVEREAGEDSERPTVAGIMIKRIANRWPLQVDAAVQYALSTSRCRIRICDWWPKSLTPADLKIVSPYNTYTNLGLPPSPIGNPGRASLEAATQPKESKYWFYLHDLDGNIHYAQTIEEHNQNICTYLKKDC